MRNLLLVTTEVSQKVLYQAGLERHFSVACAESAVEVSAEVEAVIYDLPKYSSPEELLWVEELDVPVVVLTSAIWLPLPKAKRQRVLTYPVTVKELFKALSELDVTPED